MLRDLYQGKHTLKQDANVSHLIGFCTVFRHYTRYRYVIDKGKAKLLDLVFLIQY